MDETIRAVERGFDALIHLAKAGSDRPAQIATALSLSRPTTYRILVTLETAGLIERDAERGAFRLTGAADQLSGGMTLQDRCVWTALPVLRQLQKRVTWTSHFATLGAEGMVVRESTHQLNPFSIVTRAGRSTRSLLQSALGRAYLSFCPDPERDALVERLRTAEGNDYPEDYIPTIIAQTRHDGFAREHVAIEIPAGAIALPIRCGDRVAACLDISWIYSAIRFEEAVEKFLPHLRWARHEIEHRLEELDTDFLKH